MAKPKRPGAEIFVKDAAAVYAQILSANELAQQDGKPWLTVSGRAALRRLLQANGCSLNATNALPVSPLIPAWNADLGELWLGGKFLLEVGTQSYPAMILSAFESQGWSEGYVANPLSIEAGGSAGDLRERLENAVRNLNRRLPEGTLHFRSIYRGTGVRWEYASLAIRRKRGGCMPHKIDTRFT